MKLDMHIPYEKRNIGIEFEVSGVKVKVTVTRNRKTVSAK